MIRAADRFLRIGDLTRAADGYERALNWIHEVSIRGILVDRLRGIREDGQARAIIFNPAPGLYLRRILQPGDQRDNAYMEAIGLAQIGQSRIILEARAGSMIVEPDGSRYWVRTIPPELVQDLPEKGEPNGQTGKVAFEYA